jgi:hypothetical protein
MVGKALCFYEIQICCSLVDRISKIMPQKLVQLILFLSLLLAVGACAPAANPPADLVPPSPSPAPS